MLCLHQSRRVRYSTPWIKQLETPVKTTVETTVETIRLTIAPPERGSLGAYGSFGRKAYNLRRTPQETGDSGMLSADIDPPGMTPRVAAASRAMAAYNQFFPFVSALRMAAGVLTNGTL